MPSVNLFSYNYIIVIYVLLIVNSWQIVILYYIKPPNSTHAVQVTQFVHAIRLESFLSMQY